METEHHLKESDSVEFLFQTACKIAEALDALQVLISSPDLQIPMGEPASNAVDQYDHKRRQLRDLCQQMRRVRQFGSGTLAMMEQEGYTRSLNACVFTMLVQVAGMLGISISDSGTLHGGSGFFSHEIYKDIDKIAQHRSFSQIKWELQMLLVSEYVQPYILLDYEPESTHGQDSRACKPPELRPTPPGLLVTGTSTDDYVTRHIELSAPPSPGLSIAESLRVDTPEPLDSDTGSVFHDDGNAQEDPTDPLTELSNLVEILFDILHYSKRSVERKRRAKLQTSSHFSTLKEGGLRCPNIVCKDTFNTVPSYREHIAACPHISSRDAKSSHGALLSEQCSLSICTTSFTHQPKHTRVLHENAAHRFWLCHAFQCDLGFFTQEEGIRHAARDHLGLAENLQEQHAMIKPAWAPIDFATWAREAQQAGGAGRGFFYDKNIPIYFRLHTSAEDRKAEMYKFVKASLADRDRFPVMPTRVMSLQGQYDNLKRKSIAGNLYPPDRRSLGVMGGSWGSTPDLPATKRRRLSVDIGGLVTRMQTGFSFTEDVVIGGTEMVRSVSDPGLTQLPRNKVTDG